MATTKLTDGKQRRRRPTNLGDFLGVAKSKGTAEEMANFETLDLAERTTVMPGWIRGRIAAFGEDLEFSGWPTAAIGALKDLLNLEQDYMRWNERHVREAGQQSPPSISRELLSQLRHASEVLGNEIQRVRNEASLVPAHSDFQSVGQSLREPRERTTSKIGQAIEDLAEAVPDYVTLQEAAERCHTSKRTLEDWKADGKLPLPAVEHIGRRPARWIWNDLRPHLENLTGLQLSKCPAP